MHSITVKSIPTDPYEALKRSAKANRRSINSEIIVIIEDAVRSTRIDPEVMLVHAHLLREKTAHYRISDEEINRAKGEGRP